MGPLLDFLYFIVFFALILLLWYALVYVANYAGISTWVMNALAIVGVLTVVIIAEVAYRQNKKKDNTTLA